MAPRRNPFTNMLRTLISHRPFAWGVGYPITYKTKNFVNPLCLGVLVAPGLKISRNGAKAQRGYPTTFSQETFVNPLCLCGFVASAFKNLTLWRQGAMLFDGVQATDYL